MEKIEELKHLLEILPQLEKQMRQCELVYLRQANSNYGFQENWFIYNITPIVQNNYLTTKRDYIMADQRRWELIEELGLECNFKGEPNFNENISAVDFKDTRQFRDLEFGNSPVDKPYF